MKLSPFIIAAGLVASLAGCSKPETSTAPAAPAEPPRAFGGRVTESTSASGVIESINSETRFITIKMRDGKVLSYTAGPDVRNFDQAKVGDQVHMVSNVDVTITVTNLPNEPDRVDSVDAVRAPKGDKPAVLITRRSRGVGVVEAIDYAKRTATIRGAQRTFEIEAEPEAENFAKARVGDRVFIRYIETMFIMVNTPPPPPS
jgi:hypothetical protein